MSKILICSKDEGTRESLKLLLGDTYELILTDDANQALEVTKNTKISTFLFDIKGEDPKLLNEFKDLRIIIVCGYKEDSKAQEAVRNGAEGYIVKPFKSDELLSIVK